MKKTFSLDVEGKHPDRLLDAIKHEIRKYLKRERNRALPDGVDYWDFDCKVGSTPQSATPVHVAEITRHIDDLVKEHGRTFYVEILAKHGVRKPKSE